MFINFWYTAGRSTDVTTTPVRRRMLGQDFVLFRDTTGKVHCLADTCIHRGASLGLGKVKGDCIQCPYHGWQFDGDGACRKIPSLGAQARIPARARVDAYPTVEKYGLIFAFLGDIPEEERCPILPIPEYGADGPEPGWTATIQNFEWAFDYQRSIENGIDAAHNEYVHPTHGFSGERPDYKISPDEWRWLDDQWGTGFFNKIMAPPLAEQKMREASGRETSGVIEAGTGHHGVSMIWTYIYPTPAIKIHQYLFETPIDESHTSLYLVNLRNFLTEPEHDARMTGRNEYVALQDRDVLLDVRPVLTPGKNTAEFFTPADRSIAMYREKLKRWENRGWRIDVDEVARNRRRVAYAIPCPARREVRGWILDPIPLRPADAEAAASAPSAATGADSAS
jgi:phenylpropionate dioxygenase-like ring-hydroxylating dioxygenase large terminal subunit